MIPKIKVAHEAPNSLFEFVQKQTDFDYCLAHLYNENSLYKKHFDSARSSGREIMLDTSIFELGHSFEDSGYMDIINQLKPNWYIIPDFIGDSLATIKKASQWNKLNRSKFPDSEPVAVLHGEDYVQLKACYEHYTKDLNFSYIAIPFHLPYYQTSAPSPNVHYSNMLGRILLLSRLYSEGVIDLSKKHHLLGVALPQEGLFYNHMNLKFITSVDTSNPVLHGLKGIVYSSTGLRDKDPTKLFTLVDYESKNTDIYHNISYNISMFKQFFN